MNGVWYTIVVNLRNCSTPLGRFVKVRFRFYKHLTPLGGISGN